MADWSFRKARLSEVMLSWRHCPLTSSTFDAWKQDE